MTLKQTASAGTAEGSDVTVTVEPRENRVEIEINSIVNAVFGNAIKATVTEMLTKFNVASCKISLQDHGALDCTIRARIETALTRACKEVNS